MQNILCQQIPPMNHIHFRCDVRDRAGKNLGFLEIFFRFLGFLGFNVHSAEYRHDSRQVAYMKISVC